MLDQEGFEVDKRTQREGETPLHCVVRYCNRNPEDQEYCEALVKMMLEAGCDPRYVNSYIKVKVVETDIYCAASRIMLSKSLTISSIAAIPLSARSFLRASLNANANAMPSVKRTLMPVLPPLLPQQQRKAMDPVIRVLTRMMGSLCPTSNDWMGGR